MDVQQIADSIASSYTPVTPGRPSAIGDAAVLAVLLGELRAGVHLEPACSIAGISLDAVRVWMKRGEQGEQPYALFARAVNAARASIESEVTRNILAASKLPAYWTAGATYLERTHPARWAKPSDRQDRQTAAIEVHVHGIASTEVLIGVTERDTRALTSANYSNESPGDRLIENQGSEPSGTQALLISTYAASSEIRQDVARELAAVGPTAGSAGAAPPQGAPAPAVATSMPAVQTVEKTAADAAAAAAAPSFSTAVQKTQKPLLTGATSTSTSAAKPKRVKDPSLPPHLQRCANPAAIRRMKILHREAQIKRKRRKTEKAYHDSIRHAANREAARAEKRRLAAQKAEAALPDVLVVSEGQE